MKEKINNNKYIITRAMVGTGVTVQARSIDDFNNVGNHIFHITSGGCGTSNLNKYNDGSARGGDYVVNHTNAQLGNGQIVNISVSSVLRAAQSGRSVDRSGKTSNPTYGADKRAVKTDWGVKSDASYIELYGQYGSSVTYVGGSWSPDEY